jgi:hypothetical protein
MIAAGALLNAMPAIPAAATGSSRDAQRTAVMAVGNGGNRHSVDPGARHRFHDRAHARFKCEPVAGIDQACGRLLADDDRHGASMGAPGCEMRAIGWHARHAVGGEALRVCSGEAACGGIGH